MGIAPNGKALDVTLTSWEAASCECSLDLEGQIFARPLFIKDYFFHVHLTIGPGETKTFTISSKAEIDSSISGLAYKTVTITSMRCTPLAILTEDGELRVNMPDGSHAHFPVGQ